MQTFKIYANFANFHFFGKFSKCMTEWSNVAISDGNEGLCCNQWRIWWTVRVLRSVTEMTDCSSVALNELNVSPPLKIGIPRIALTNLFWENFLSFAKKILSFAKISQFWENFYQWMKIFSLFSTNLPLKLLKMIVLRLNIHKMFSNAHFPTEKYHFTPLLVK